MAYQRWIPESRQATGKAKFIPPFLARKWYHSDIDIAVTCPQCSAEARFLPATVRPLSKANVEPVRKAREIDVYEMPKGHWNGSFHQPFYGVFYHGMGRPAPEGWEPPKRWATDLGTLRCPSCNYCRRHHLDLPASAHYQLNFDGQLLFFYSREHVLGVINLLEAKNQRGLPWSYWFDNKLPEHFKTVKARKVLPARLRKLVA